MRTLGQRGPLFALVGLMLVSSFPVEYRPIGRGIDGSWEYGINALARSEYRFGRDVVFTYGPLGYLIEPRDVHDNLFAGVLFQTLLQAIMVGLIAVAAARRGRWWVALPIAVVLPLFAGPLVEYLPVLVVALAAWQAVEHDRVALFFAAGVLSVLAGMIKLTLGVVTLSMLAVASGLWIAQGGRTALRSVAAGWAAVFGSLLVFGRWQFGSFALLGSWLRLSLEIARGYSEAMSIEGPALSLYGALACLVLFALFTVEAWRRGWEARRPALILVPTLLLAFKHGFVRQDGHQAYFFTFACGAWGVVALAASSWRALSPAVVGVALAWGMLATTAGSHWSGSSSLARIEQTIRFERTRARLRAESEHKLRGEQLPPDWLARIGRSTVDTPIEISLCAANGLHWRPMPTLQEYATITPVLDRFGAGSYLGERAPDYILFDFDSIDDRNPVLSAPATWRAIVKDYAPAAEEPHLLLARKADRPNERTSELGRDQIDPGAWVSLPHVDSYLLAALDLEPTLSGRLRRLFFRGRSVFLDLEYQSGRAERFRIVPSTAADGLLINAVPSRSGDLAALMRGRVADRVVAMRLAGPGVAELRHPVRVTWSRYDNGTTPVFAAPDDELLSLPLVDRPSTFSLFVDTVNARAMDGRPVEIDSDSPGVSVRGWAFDPRTGGPAGGVVLEVDGRMRVAGVYGSRRDDVAAAFKKAELARSGFSATLALARLSQGTHQLTVLVATAERTALYRASETITVDVR